jgi:hypothetical protein
VLVKLHGARVDCDLGGLWLTMLSLSAWLALTSAESAARAVVRASIIMYVWFVPTLWVVCGESRL